jgi:uncharacterized protein YbaA (DUF1428 family)
VTTAGAADVFEVSMPSAAKRARQARSGASTARSSTGNASADDVKKGELTSFPQSVELKRGETVVFAWIEFKSRAHRDRVNPNVMQDPRLADQMDPNTMPFDTKRMIYCGFEVVVEV